MEITQNINHNNIIELPVTSISENSYRDFYKICKAYYQELKIANSNNTKLSKDDVIVLNDLIKEMNSYVSILIQNNFTEEGKKLNHLCIKMINELLKIFTNPSEVYKNRTNENKMNKLLYPFTLKLAALEMKFQINFHFVNNYEESEKTINEVIKVQNILQLQKYHIGCSTFYLAVVKFCKKYLNKILFSFK
jgi:hypothetical protein